MGKGKILLFFVAVAGLLFVSFLKLIDKFGSISRKGIK
jgi:hypothetical protein